MSGDQPPRVVVLAGINGAGKTTASQVLLREVLKIPTFVNADLIARGLNLLNPESVSVAAGKVMLNTLHELAAERADFAFETTLAGKSYARWLESLRATGYCVHLYYYWLESPEVAIERIRIRVLAGGHFVPDATVRQRYKKSVYNFCTLFRPLADEWEVYDNTHRTRQLLAAGCRNEQVCIGNAARWKLVERSARDV